MPGGRYIGDLDLRTLDGTEQLIGRRTDLAADQNDGIRITIDELSTYLGTSGGGGAVASIKLACADDSTVHRVTCVKDAGSGEYTLYVDPADSGGTADTLTLTCADDSTDHPIVVQKDSETGEYMLYVTP